MKGINSVWRVLLEAIGVKISTRSVWQMHADGMTKVEEDFFTYHGPMAFANAGAGGRPVLTAAQLQQYSVGTGTSDVIWNPLYDSISYPSAGLAIPI